MPMSYATLAMEQDSMTTIRTTCTSCGDVELTIDDAGLETLVAALGREREGGGRGNRERGRGNGERRGSGRRGNQEGNGNGR